MTSRERLDATLNHRQPDRVVVDLGATGQTGMSASTLYRFRKALGLEEKPVEISEMFQLLGRIEKDVMDWAGSDVVGLNMPSNMFGVPDGPLKPFRMPDGTPTLISEGNEYDVNPDGSMFLYPQGNRNATPSGHMPAGGYFFDNILSRVEDFDEDNLIPAEDYANDFSVISDETAAYLEKKSKFLFEETDYGIIGNLGGFGLGDSAIVAGPHLLEPKGIRRFDDWLAAHILYPEYIRTVYEMQTEVMLKNLEIYRQAVGNRIQVVWLSGTDFGTQNSEFFSVDIFRDLYKPYYKKINDWVHQNTSWKTYYHCCGSIVNYLDEFVEMGVDVLNPVQVSARGMDANMLKDKYGDKLVFWGGGVDTQKTLPFGTPEEVRRQVRERLEIFSKNGGYVFSPIHNVVAKTPVENIIAMYETVREFNGR
ncbi:MAG: methyltransferase [Clostridia bacterium]|nr:methyltransferase [Clostridia bacterium]